MSQPSTANTRPKEYWGSRIGIILAVMGSAIGLGNFLRFPGLAAKYDAGVFMIPYFIAFLLLGLPIAYTEWAIGRYGGLQGFNSSPGIFRSLWKNRLSPYLGVLGLLVPVGIYMYYVFIESWCLYYAYAYLAGQLDLGSNQSSYQAFFANFTGLNENGFLLANGGLSPSLIALLVAFFLNFALIYRGLNKGIETLSRYGVPALFLIALVILGRVLSFGTPDPAYPERNVINALGYMWNPNTEKGLLESLANSQMWLEAAGQIFFTLSVGFGVIITYASYLRRDDDIVLSATTSAAGNEFAEVALGGMITITAAFLFLGADGTSGSTFQLGFVTMPVVFAHMPWGNLFGFLWFFLLFIAALTSSISMLQPAIAFFEEGLGSSRKISSTLLAFITLAGSLFIVYFSRDLKALDTMDFWIGSFLIFTLASIEVILAGWVFGADKILAHAREGALIRLSPFFGFVIKYISPAYLLIIFGFWSVQNMPAYIEEFHHDPVVKTTILFILMLAGFFVTLTFSAVRRWKKQEEIQARINGENL